MAELVYLKDVVTLELDVELCNGCAVCLEVCPHAVFSLRDKRSRIERRDACMECGACARNCEQGALRVKSGVGCAAAVINAALGRSAADCCCVIEDETGTEPGC